MRLQIIKSKNAQSLYVVKSVYHNKKRTNKVVEKFGTYDKLKENLNEDPIAWAKNYVKELNKQEKAGTRNVLVKYSPTKIIEKKQQNSFNGGYLFLEKIYYELGLNDICKDESIGNGYIPTYTRTDLTDDLHDKFGFRTDYQIITNSSLKKIFKKIKE